MASPDYVVKTEIGKSKSGTTIYLTIGKAWANRAGGVSIVLDAIPTGDGNGKIKMVAWPYDPSREGRGGGQRGGGGDAGHDAGGGYDGGGEAPF